MDISARSLHIKREVITKLLNEGLYPYTKRYLGSFDNHFSTIGLVGMNEAGLNAKWLGCDMSDPRTQKFTKESAVHPEYPVHQKYLSCILQADGNCWYNTKYLLCFRLYGYPASAYGHVLQDDMP